MQNEFVGFSTPLWKVSLTYSGFPLQSIDLMCCDLDAFEAFSTIGATMLG